MANLQIEAGKFEAAKNNIKNMSNQVADVSLKYFNIKDKFLFFERDHKITGQEINDIIKTLQQTFKKINTNTQNTYKSLEEIYQAFESLDKEYIQGLMNAIKSSQLASDQAKEASNIALDVSTKVQMAQADIKQTIEALQITVKTLIDFKAKVLNNLTTTENIRTQIVSLESRIDNIWQLCALNPDIVRYSSEKALSGFYSNKRKIIFLCIIALTALALTIGQLIALLIL